MAPGGTGPGHRDELKLPAPLVYPYEENQPRVQLEVTTNISPLLESPRKPIPESSQSKSKLAWVWGLPVSHRQQVTTDQPDYISNKIIQYTRLGAGGSMSGFWAAIKKICINMASLAAGTGAVLGVNLAMTPNAPPATGCLPASGQE